MATQRPISTISYNTEPFLKEKLENLYKQHIIQSYMYICHKGEGGDKDHIHLRIEPNKRLDPMDILELLKEYQAGSDKPLGCRPFRNSKEEDWVLYAVHDADYLKLKYSSDKNEKLPYSWQDIQAPSDYDVETAYIRAKQSLEHSPANMATRIMRGTSSSDLVGEGYNVFQVNAVMQAIRGNDYTRVQNELQTVRQQLLQLRIAIENEGYAIVLDDEQRLTIEKPNGFRALTPTEIDEKPWE